MGEGSASNDFLTSAISGGTTPTEPGPCDISVGPGSNAGSPYRQMLQKIFPLVRDDAAYARPVPKNTPLDLEPGEWVMVRSLKEIDETLDEQRRSRGLYFMPEMEGFCGQRFRVLKKVRTIKLESTGEVRRLKDPTVLLEGVYCDGTRHQGCDRACLHLWRETWLARVPDKQSLKEPSAPAIGI